MESSIKVTDPVLGVEIQVLANIFSAIAYGFVVILFCSCLWVLRDTKQTPARQIRPFLYLYIIFMFAMGTMAFVQETVYTTKVLKNDIFPKGPNLVDYLTSLGEPIPLPFTIWGADGFMASEIFIEIMFYVDRRPLLQLWRCWVLYQDISPTWRLLLFIFLTLLCLTSAGMYPCQTCCNNSHLLWPSGRFQAVE